MNKRTGSNLTMLLCSATLTFFSGNAISQNIAIDPSLDDCLATDPQSDDAASMAAHLSCYNHKLDNLTQLLSGLINERKRLNSVIGEFQAENQQPLATDSALVSEQQQTIQQLQLERAKLRSQLHSLLSKKQPIQLNKETDERLFRNYSEAYAALSIENDELRKLLTEYQESTTNSLATANALETTNEQQSAQIAGLNDEIASLKLTIADLSTRKKKLTNEFTRAESRIELMKKQLLANAALINLQRDDIGSLHQAQLDSAAELDSADQNFAQIKAQNAETIGNLIATKEKLYDQINTVTVDRDQLKKQVRLDSLNSMATLGARDKEISALDTAQRDLTAKLASAEEALNAANEAHANEISNLNDTNNQLNTSNDELTETASANNSTIENLQIEIQNQVDQLNLSTQKIAALETDLEAANTATVNVSQARETALDTNAKLNDEIANLKLTIADLSTRKKKLTNEFNTAESRIELMKKQLLTNAELINLQRDNIDSLQQSQLDSAAELDSADQNFAQFKAQNAETIGNLIATKEKLYDQINTVTEDRDQLKKQARQASLNSMATLGARDKEISALDKSLKELDTAHRDLTTRLATAEEVLTTANEAHTNEISDLNDTNNQLNTSNDVLTDTVSTNNATIENLQNNLQNQADQLGLSMQNIAALEAELQAANSTTADLSQARDTALDTNENLTEQLQTRLTQVNALQNERDRMAAELNVARPEIVSLNKSIETKNAESLKQTNTIDTLQSEIEQSAATNADLNTKLTDSEERNSAASEKIKTLTAAVTSLENILKESMASNKHIEASLADIKTDLNASQKRLDTKQSQLQALMAEKSALLEAHNALAKKSETLAADIAQKLKANGADSVQVTRLEDNSLVLKVDSSQLFRTGSSRLSKEGQNLLANVGSAISDIENRRIMIEGHSDNVPLGAKLSAIFKDNLGLSMARALSTAKFFTKNANIPANKMSVSGAGATKPLAGNDTSEGRQLNRRVEILLLPTDGDPMASLK